MTRDHIEGFLTGVSAGVLLAYIVKATGEAGASRDLTAATESDDTAEPVVQTPQDETLRWSAKA